MRTLPSTGFTALGLAAALVITTLVSWPALSGPFLFDDFPNLENLRAINGRLDWATLANYASLYRGEPGRPLSMLSFVINDYDWPTAPWPFKYTNLMLHLLVGVLVFGLARTLARLRSPNARADLAALIVAFAWLLHPMQLSTSMLVVQRMTQLSVMFSLAGVWGYVAIAKRAQTPATALAAIGALGSGTILAVLCKETGALTPLLALVVNATLLRDHLRTLPALPQRILLVGTAVPVLALVAGIAVRWDALTSYSSRPFDLTERLLSQCRALCEYLFSILVPSLRGGGLYHDDFAISRGLLTPWTTLPALLCVVGLLLAALFARCRWPVLSFGLLWFFAGHLLESTVFPLELYFEHRNYLPMFGILFASSVWIVEVGATSRKWLLGLACLWIVFAALLTSIEAPVWGSKQALASVWAIEHPQSPRAIQQHAADYYERGDMERAADTLLHAYDRGVRGTDFPAQALLLACMNNNSKLADRARPLIPDSLSTGEYTRALPVTMRKLRAQIESDNCPNLLAAEEWLAMTDSLLKNPNYSSGEAAAYLHRERSYYFRSRRDLNSTMTELEKAWAANPTPQLAHLVSATLASAGLYDQASVWASRALQFRTEGIRGLFARDDTQSLSLMRSIEEARQAAAQEHDTSRNQHSKREAD